MTMDVQKMLLPLVVQDEMKQTLMHQDLQVEMHFAANSQSEESCQRMLWIWHLKEIEHPTMLVEHFGRAALILVISTRLEVDS